MRYEKATIEMVGNAQDLVLGLTKNTSNVPDAYPSIQVHSVPAYEADE